MTAISNREDSEVSARFQVLEPGSSSFDDESTPCVIGQDIVVTPDKIGNYCLRTLPRRIDDLVLLAGVVAYADKAAPRHVSRSWRRRMHVSIPVLEPDYWSQRMVQRALSATLGLLTGDSWNFEFTARRSALTPGRQAVLPFGDAPALVMPFSDGLDSLAVARLTAAAKPDSGLILVTAGRLRDPDAEWRVRHLRGRYHRVSMPFSFPRRASNIRFREPSYRTRAFVFGAMAGVAAHLLGAERILVSESGQGALGPWLTPVGNEAPDLRMHPVYTRQLAALLTLVFERQVSFDHPRLWSTKGGTITALKAAGLAEDWEKTRSCSRDSRYVSLDGGRVQCGMCANCLLRRQSIMAAGLDESKERYLWSKLSADELTLSADGNPREASRADQQHGVCGVLAMAELATLGQPDRKGLSIDWAISELADALVEPIEEISGNLLHLLATHRAEWLAFVAAQGPGSFISRWAGLALC